MEERDLSADKWYKLRNPFRIIINAFICEICKYLPIKAKNFLYRLIGVEIGEGVVISPHVQIDPFFPDKIKIEENTVIGMYSKLFTHEHDGERFLVGDIEIGKNVLLGHSSSMRPGVSIGENATVAAHSFVNRDVEDGSEVGGVPIEKI